MPIKITSDALENVKNLEQIADDSMATWKKDWGQNLKHLSGLLLDATRETLVTVSNAYRHRLKQRARVSGEPVALNLILPRAARFVARHLNLMGGLKTATEQSGRDAKNEAKALAKVGQSMWDNKKLDVACVRALVYMLGCQHGYVKIEGVPNAKLRHEANEQGEMQAFPQGDVVYSALPPSQVKVYPNIQELQNTPMLIIEEFLDAEEIKRRWDVEPPDNAESASYDVEHMGDLVPQLEKVAYKVKRLFIKPSPTRLFGEHHVIMGGEVIFSSKLPDGRLTIDTYDFKYPLVDFADAPISFGYHGLGRQTAARTVVKIICATWSRMVGCSVGLPGIFMDMDERSDIAEEGLANPNILPIYRGAQSSPVGFHTVPRMPHHESMLNYGVRWLDEIYAQSPSSRGQLPAPRTPYKGMEFLAQQDVLADTPTGKMVLRAMRELFERALGEGLRVWGDEHVEYLLGEGHEPERVALERRRLGKGWKVFIIPGAGNLQSKEMQRHDINESVKVGVLPPEQARKLAGYYVQEEVFEPKRAQERIVDMEEEAFEQGYSAPINDYDDHELHIRQHDHNAAMRHQLAGEIEVWRRLQHRVAHLQAFGLKNQALLADQQAAEMEAQLGGEAPQEPEQVAPTESPPEEAVRAMLGEQGGYSGTDTEL